MNKTVRMVLLTIISILIVIVLVSGITYAFMQPQIDSSTVTEVSLSSCAKISLKGESSINLNNTYPMSKNRVLQNTPYTFTVTSSCDGRVGFNLYLGTLNTNTLDASKIRYIITQTGTKTIVQEGILGSLEDVKNTFTNAEITEYNTGIKGTVGSIYKIYNEDLALMGNVTYDLYLYVDGEVTSGHNQSETFTAGVAVKAYDIGE